MFLQLFLSSVFSFFQWFYSHISISSFPTLVGALISIFQLSLFFLFPTLSPIYPFPSSALVICCPVWLLQTHRAAPPLWDGVLPRPLGGPALGGGEAGVRTIIRRIFHSGLLSPPPLSPGGKTTSPAVLPSLPHLGGWWCSLANEILSHFCSPLRLKLWGGGQLTLR